MKPRQRFCVQAKIITEAGRNVPEVCSSRDKGKRKAIKLLYKISSIHACGND
jgi:hypothetical protein